MIDGQGGAVAYVAYQTTESAGGGLRPAHQR